MYDIARYLPEDARRAAAAATYLHRRVGPPRTADGCCPLGVALNAMALPEDVGGPFEDPSPLGIAYALNLLDVRIGRAFTNDWDNGRIRNLAAALGVPAGEETTP